VSTALTRRPLRPRIAIQRFFRTPKGLLTIVLVVLVALAAPAEGIGQVWPGLAAAIIAAMLIDAPILRVRHHAWEFPSGALLTGLIVAMVLSPQEPWHVTAITSAGAIVSKYLFRTRSANIFNPAALALVATFHVFGTGQSWWGALPNITSYGLIALVATGVFISDRVNKTPLVLAFLGSYYLLFTITAFAGDPRHVAEIFRSPDLQAVLYFAFFILTDPPTAPSKYPHQFACGAIVAGTSFAVFEWIGAADYLLIAVLVGNIWETWRRTRHRPSHRSSAHRTVRDATA
jgi:Na+-translocating ferredoxin:NAD+ oxidoreductase RnfD subunit